MPLAKETLFFPDSAQWKWISMPRSSGGIIALYSICGPPGLLKNKKGETQ